MNFTTRTVTLAVVAEAMLGVVAVAICWWFDVPLAERLTPTVEIAPRSLTATLPMLALLMWSIRSTWRPIVELRRQVTRMVGELFRNASLLDLALLSVAAGVGEELLFRGALQPLAERLMGPAAGLVFVSVLFGGVHSASRAYFLLATGVGFYLGWLSQHYEELLTPIVVHAAYDFAALVVLRGRVASERG